MSKQQIVNLPFAYANGLAVSWASNTTLSVALGQCRDSTNAFDLVISAAKTINAAVNGVNGLDTGTFAASTTYAVFVIGDSSGFSATGTLISTSATAPVLPTGYDIFKRVGWAFSDSSTHFILATQTGNGLVREYWFDTMISVLSGGSSATLAAVDLSAAVPAIKAKVYLNAIFTPNAAADVATITSGSSVATTILELTGVVAAKAQAAQLITLSTLVSSVPKIQYKVTASGALTLYVTAFEDTL